MNADVIVIGGGTAGLMASISAAENEANVLLLEKGNVLGRKLTISGGGRCNVTNRLPVDEVIKHIPGNGRFLYSAFSIYNNEDIISFFEGMGVALKEEDHGRMFPVSDDAKSVVNALINKLKKLNVQVKTNTSVKEVLYEDGRVIGVQLQDGKIINTKSVILAVGGKSVPHTGSTGDGYAWAKKAGHTITELFPTEVPITSNERFIQEKTLQGLALRDIELSVLNPKGKKVITHKMDMLFTHFGVSGPAALRCSQFVYKVQQKFKTKDVNMTIDLFPSISEETLFQETIKKVKEDPKKAIKNVLKGLAPERYLLFLLDQCKIDESKPCNEINSQKIRELVQACKQFTFTVNGTLSIEKAFVTGGGISTKEVHPKEMASKLMNGLYFCGEILDIHGYTGGYNITAAFVTGRIAGASAAQYVKEQ
ncbi:NAD(P)/FAD-dependent oxidoreductase [Bacillus sp. RG28]|uniref:NAD(P)/FAD-dependent oxidoreductase n=1 Tax=Gottfriedia endophytica TaxID=2820819 RepID=A0A940SKT2_9BACI|nr:NAD(P)/FAD-dependent oxidoreductase [Gottfriedia endophytica]MBP0726349.1 NAD(P)/FAD-dependent oxidoreductase [Gottfriedia endophytica]